MTPESKDLIEKFLNPDPEKRLGANGVEEIMSHPWFKGCLIHVMLSLQLNYFVKDLIGRI